MRRLIVLVVVIVFVTAILGPILFGFGVRAATPPRDDANALMQKKLAHAQRLLEGIALADLDLVGKHASDLSELSKQVQFKVVKTPQYELCANEFRRSLDDIQKGVRQKNIDAATLGYMDLTMTCVRCHKHVREVRIARR